MCRPRIFRLRGDSCGWLLCSSTTAFSQQLELVIVFQGAENGPRHILQRQKELRDFYTSVSLPSSLASASRCSICCQTILFGLVFSAFVVLEFVLIIFLRIVLEFFLRIFLRIFLEFFLRIFLRIFLESF